MLRAAALHVITTLGLAVALTSVGAGCDRSPDEPPAKRKEPAAASEAADKTNNGDPADETSALPSLTNIALALALVVLATLAMVVGTWKLSRENRSPVR